MPISTIQPGQRWVSNTESELGLGIVIDVAHRPSVRRPRPDADEITGNALDNHLGGGRGDDTIIGADGNDTASFAESAAPVTADLGAGTATGQGSDTLTTIEEIERLFGREVARLVEFAVRVRGLRRFALNRGFTTTL